MDIRGFNTVNSYRTNFTLVNKAGAEMDEIKNGFIDVTHEPSSLFYEKGELVDDILEITFNFLDGNSTWHHVIERQQDIVLFDTLCTTNNELRTQFLL